MAIVTRTQSKIDILGFLKTNFWGIVLALYIIGSLYFMASSLYNGVIAQAFTNGAQRGYQQAIVELAAQVEKSWCTPLPINFGQGKSISIVNATCTSGTSVPSTGK